MKQRLKTLADLCAFVTVLIALLGLFGYMPGFRILGSLSEDYIPMAPSTAISFIVLGAVLLSLGKSIPTGAAALMAATATGCVSIFGLLCAVDFWLDMGLNLEDRLIPAAGTLNGIPVARMAPVTGVVFFLTAFAVLIFFRGQISGKQSRFAEYVKGSLSLAVMLIGFVFTLAYLFGKPLLYQQNTIPMALTTALAFLFLAFSLIAAGKSDFPLGIFAGSSTRSYLLRYLLPFSVVIVVVSGLIMVSIENVIHINPALVFAVLSVVIAIIAGGIATLIAQHIGGEIDRSKAAVKLSNDMLKASEEKQRITLNSIGDAVIATDVDQMITHMNPVAETLTGWPLAEAIGRNVAEVFNIVNAKTRKPAKIPIDEVMKYGEVVGLANHTALLSRSGREYQIADSAAPIKNLTGEIVGVVMVFRDVTEEYHMQEEMQKVQRLKSIGTLAGGIAHDFNNILTGIYGNVSLAKEMLGSDHPALSHLEESEKSLERAVHLTRQLLTFAVGGNPIKENVSLGKLAEEVVNFDLTGSKVKLVIDYPPDLPVAEVDKGQIQQVFSNLAINAKEAMPMGGCLFVSMKSAEITAQETLKLNPGKYIKVTVRDEGTGIPPEHHEKIFDPYFSTKKAGSGLGLATTYSIIKRHGGNISLDSQVDRGTTFTFYLPAADAPAISEAEDRQTATLPLNHTARILVMDDEKAIRTFVVRALEKIGCEVKEAACGNAAIQLFQQAHEAGQPFDAVIMDLTIPGGIGGKEAVGEILKIDPNVAAIVSSGYADDPVMSDYAKFGFKALLPKPYNINTLHNVLKTVLKNKTIDV